MNAFKIVDLPGSPALHGSAIEPSDPHQHVDWRDVMLGGERRLRSADDAIKKLVRFVGVIGVQGRVMSNVQ